LVIDARFEPRPFAHGACRHAYRCLKKEYAKDYGALNADISASKTASEYATLFNAQRFINRSLYF